jgi:hypothetical protein
MPILQQQPPETDASVRILATSLDPPQDLEYPHPPPPAVTSNAVMPLLLWGMLLLLGILMLLVRGPINAPGFEQLTQYVRDPLPNLPSLGNRFQSYALNPKCRAGDQTVYQRGLPAYSNNPAGTSCRRAGGLIRIWRVAKPSAYGPYVFHATCNEHIITYYQDRAAAYESAQHFIIALACIIVLASLTGVGLRVLHSHRRHSESK